MPQLQGSLAVGGTSAIHGSSGAQSVRWRSAAAAVGLVLVLAPAAITALAERGPHLVQPGPDVAAPGSQAVSNGSAPQSASLLAAQALSSALPAAAERRAANAYARLPLAFVPNAGQIDAWVRYYAQGVGYGFYFTDRKAVLALQKGERGQALELRFLGANPNPDIEAADRGSGRVNYLTGSSHHTNLPTYGRLIYRDLWPGIDMVFRGKGGRLNYEFRLRPGAKVPDIRLAYAGADTVSLGRGGDLLIDTPLGTLRDARPQSFQRVDGRRVAVDSRYGLAGDSYGFRVGDHDRTKPLVIDPSLAYSTYLGGSNGDLGLGIAVDSAGAAYVTGTTGYTDYSPDIPTTPGAFDPTAHEGTDAFVTKLNPAGSELVYSTYLGGDGFDWGDGIAVDAAGAAYVVGSTRSAWGESFPTTAAAFDPACLNEAGPDAFVTKLSPDGSELNYSTCLAQLVAYGDPSGIAVDSHGAAYITGFSLFADALGTIDSACGSDSDNAFVTKLNPAGSDVVYSTCLGGTSYDDAGGITVDGAGAAYVTGSTESTDFPTTAGAFDTSPNGYGEAFVTKINSAGTRLAYSTYLSGASSDVGGDIAVDSAGAAYVTGWTTSADFPTSAGALDTSANGRDDGFVTKLDPAGSGLDYSSFLGGSGFDGGGEIAVDSAGAAYVTGRTSSTDFPTTAGAFDTSLNGGFDAFVTKLTSAGSGLDYSSFLGGSDSDRGDGIAVDSAGAAYVTGFTDSTDFPTSAGAFDISASGGFDAFVTKLTFAPPPSTPRCSVTNGGRITADNGDGATFGGNARSDAAANVNGQETYRDHGPAQPLSVKSIRIMALTCNQERSQASIFGEATIDGSGTRAFEIEVEDLGEPGTGIDTYRIVLDTGYDSGVHTLESGNVRIREP